MRVLTASDRALLVETEDLAEAMRLDLAWRVVPGVDELVPGARSVLVRFDPALVSARTLAARLRRASATDEHIPPAGEAVIPVRYDGEDLTEVARLLGVSTDEVVTRHLASRWQVAFSGFAPGFGYAVGSDPLFDVPRRPSPRTRVPAGSVGLAGHFTGVYPRESPGGWQLIGRTDAVMWNIDRDPPALVAPGTVIRFRRAERDSVRAASVEPAARHAMSASGRVRGEQSAADVAVDAGVTAAHDDAASAHIEVVRAPLQLLVQDAGRPGHAGLGVSASGVVDRTAMHDANRAVGNASDAAVLECAGGGATLRFDADGVVAVTGALCGVTVTDEQGARHPAGHGVPFAVTAGDALTLAAPTRGLRSVIAVRGGIAASAALGSRATDTLAGLGPAPLRTGDTVSLGDPHLAPLAVDPLPLPRDLPAIGDVVDLHITLGPRDEWFTPAAIAVLTGQEWDVTPRSDRVGVRLHGAVALQRTRSGELPSEGTVTGALQVPPDGQPVLFLADHPLTGGYPVIGAVADDDLDLAGQLAPGVHVRFIVDPMASSAPEEGQP